MEKYYLIESYCGDEYAHEISAADRADALSDGIAEFLSHTPADLKRLRMTGDSWIIGGDLDDYYDGKGTPWAVRLTGGGIADPGLDDIGAALEADHGFRGDWWAVRYDAAWSLDDGVSTYDWTGFLVAVARAAGTEYKEVALVSSDDGYAFDAFDISDLLK